MIQLLDHLAALVDSRFEAECAFLAEMVRIPTDNPPGDCAAHAERAATLLSGLGFSVERFAVPDELLRSVGMRSATNLIVRRRFGSGGPTIALNAHGDVVAPGLGWTHDPYGAEVVDDPDHGPTMYGRGVAVSKSDFATYSFALLALQALEAHGATLNGTIELHLTYDEEVGGDIGPGWLLSEGATRPDLVVSAGFGYSITTAHNGCLHLEVTVHGRQGHAAMPASGIDALAATNRILSALYDTRDALAQVHSATPGIDTPTLNIGLIEGGINTNVVPDRVTFRLDRRVIPEEDFDAAETALRTLIEQTAAQSPGISVSIRRVLRADPLVRLPGAQPLIDALQRNGSHYFGCEIKETGVPLYTDARHYAAAGIPTVLYGAGPRMLSEAKGHMADENLRLGDLRKATCTIAATLSELMRG